MPSIPPKAAGQTGLSASKLFPGPPKYPKYWTPYPEMMGILSIILGTLEGQVAVCLSSACKRATGSKACGLKVRVELILSRDLSFHVIQDRRRAKASMVLLIRLLANFPLQPARTLGHTAQQWSPAQLGCAKELQLSYQLP